MDPSNPIPGSSIGSKGKSKSKSRWTLDGPTKAVFLREARALLRLKHPNVVEVYGIAMKPYPVIVMEDCGAEAALSTWIRQNVVYTGPGQPVASSLPAATLLSCQFDLAIGVARGMQALHDAGLIHADLKPGNVMVTLVRC